MNNLNGMIFNIQRFSVNDGPGIRTTVFFKGCPLNCTWCHNPESRSISPEKCNKNPYKNFTGFLNNGEDIIGQSVYTDLIIKEIEKDYLFYEESKGGVTFSGGEPLMQLAFLNELLTECKERDINTAVDTSGYASSDQLLKIIPYVDLFLFDLKIMNDSQHKKYIGVSNKLIHSNLESLSNAEKKIVIRVPLIPGITDTDGNLKEIISFILKLENILWVSLLPYNEMAPGKYKNLDLEYKLSNLSTQTPEFLDRVYRKFTSAGFEVKLRG